MLIIRVGMKERNIIKDNRRAGYFSFLFYLHEEKEFHSGRTCCSLSVSRKDGFCHSLEQLKDLRWIECQILRHMVYHFDPNDLSRIRNLPTNYWEELEAFEQVVSKLYDRYE